ncbi:MAG: methionine adenosyltransferase [Candidatus Ranarchaeia archaeon]
MKNFNFAHMPGLPVAELPTEIVERKGKGHPDVLCDKAAEEMSIALSEHYEKTVGRVLHHNVDKCVLAGGSSNARLGGGEVIEPIYLLLVGRAVGILNNDPDTKVPIGKYATRNTKDWLKKDVRNLDTNCDIIIDYKIRAGSTDLVGNFDEGSDIPRANDTSFGVSYAPLSDLETLVHKSEKLLNSEETYNEIPAVGEDIKVMGVRSKERITLTVASALVAKEVKNRNEYEAAKKKIEAKVSDAATSITDIPVVVNVNTADTEKTVYVTVTGTSAESGDDGQVGRGNRANGLITPYRPMTLEACAGKNPVSHVGKTYNIAARVIAERLIKEEPLVKEANVYIVSQIGKPITEPQALDILIHAEQDLDRIKTTAESISEEVMDHMPKIWKGFMERKYELY